MRASRISDQRGASAVEFAVIASLLLLILFGTITFGIVFNRYQGLQSAAREGARLGSLSGTTRSEILDRVRDSVSIVEGSAIAASCPSNVNTLAVETGCLKVFARPSPGAAPTEVTPSSTAQAPCGAAYPGPDKSVVVEVYYRLRIDIPLWASPQMTVSGGAEFKCEGS
jgi:Flp pilus assembly protein TadG